MLLLDSWLAGWVGGWVGGWVDRRTDGRMDGWMDGWIVAVNGEGSYQGKTKCVATTRTVLIHCL